MQVTETNADGLTREFKIVVSAGDLEDQISRRLDELGRAINLPGFRPGKVPMQLLRKRYGSAVRGEVLESTVQDGSAETIREHKLRPALPPKIEILSAAEGADLEYKMSVELLPEMPEPNFAELHLEKLRAAVPDDRIEQAVQRLAEQQRRTEPVDRAAANGDIVVADLVGRVGEQEIPGSRGEGREIELGATGFIPGFDDQLIGAVAGEQRTVRVSFPEDNANPELAGKEAVFEVAVKEVRDKRPAAIDDALAEAVGLDSLDELRQEIRRSMQREFDDLSRQRVKRELLDRLAERVGFPVPPGMLEMEFESIWKQYEAEKARQTEAAATTGMVAPQIPGQASDGDSAGGTEDAPAIAERPPELSSDPVMAAPAEDVPESAPADPTQADAEEQEARAEYRRIAERRVRLGLLLAEVGRNNNITVTQEELNQALAREARRFPGHERQVLDYYRKNPESMNNLRAPIFEDKVVDFILELATVEERQVTPEELMSFPEPEHAEPEAPAPGPEAAAPAP